MRKEKLVEKLAKGQITGEEAQELLGLIQSDASAPSDELMLKIWKASQSQVQPAENAKKRVLRKVEKQLAVDEVATPPRKNRIWKLTQVAAALALLVLASLPFLPIRSTENLIQTGQDEQINVALQDGSWMRLNENSLAQYSSARSVSLTGEAYFDVEKKPNATTFEVRTEHAILEVLGTRFNVKSTDEYTRVFLEEGVVRFYCPDLDSLILMEPGDLVYYEKASEQLTIRKNEIVQTHTGWREGVTILENVSLSQVLSEIEQMYAIEFEVGDQELLKRKMTFPLPTTSLDTAIALLENTLIDLNIIKNETHYLIE